MSDAELLATIIHAGHSTAAARDLAARLLERFGGLRQVLQADCDALMAEYGIGRSESIVVTHTGCERFSNLPREVIIKR